MDDVVDVSRIRVLNDAFRHSLTSGVLMMTRGVIALGLTRQLRILEAVAAFDGFDPDDDPCGEHDFGALEIEGMRLFFKIEYYAPEGSRATRLIRLTLPPPPAC